MKKESMPDYTRSGYVAHGRRVEKNLQDRNQIRSEDTEVSPHRIERHLSPGAGYRVESVEQNKHCRGYGQKINAMPPVHHEVGGVSERLPKGKMRNEGGDRDPNK